MCLFEWKTLAPASSNKTEGDNTSLYSRHLICAFSVASIFITIIPTTIVPPVLMTSGILLKLLPHFQSSKVKPSAENVYLTIQHYQFGLLYLSIGFHYLIQIAMSNRGAYHVGNLLFVVWMSDTGALICGRTMKNIIRQIQAMSKVDRNRYFVDFLHSISPGKTVIGLLGALVTGPVCALVYPVVFESNNDEFLVDGNTGAQRAFFGFIIAIAGILGDLAESSVKRLSAKKDSGKLLPGHGGVVDRFDSLLPSAVVYHLIYNPGT